jgi:hypothetical protein
MFKILPLVALLFTISVQAQKKEKLKGSKVVTAHQLDIAEFTSLEIDDNMEVFLTQGSKCEAEIEADDNLHDAFVINESEGNLRISLSKEIVGAKKIAVKITYTDNFKMLLAKNDSYITALTDMNLTDFTFKTHDGAKVFATVKATQFNLLQNDKSKIELNLTSDEAAIELSKNANLKALINVGKLKLDLYQKGAATIEGDVNDLRLRMDGNSSLTAQNLTAQQTELIAEGNCNLSIFAASGISMECSGKSEVDLYGEPTIEIRKFTDNAIIKKKVLKK